MIVERLLRRAEPCALPASCHGVAAVLAAAAAPGHPAELADETAAAASFLAARAAATRNADRRGRSRVRRVAACMLGALAVALSTVTAVGAGTGSLPDPAQEVAHQALSAIGISVPRGVTPIKEPSPPPVDGEGSAVDGTSRERSPQGTPSPSSVPAADPLDARMTGVESGADAAAAAPALGEAPVADPAVHDVTGNGHGAGRAGDHGDQPGQPDRPDDHPEPPKGDDNPGSGGNS